MVGKWYDQYQYQYVWPQVTYSNSSSSVDSSLTWYSVSSPPADDSKRFAGTPAELDMEWLDRRVREITDLVVI